jgi:hypothetical protein
MVSVLLVALGASVIYMHKDSYVYGFESAYQAQQLVSETNPAGTSYHLVPGIRLNCGDLYSVESNQGDARSPD